MAFLRPIRSTKLFTATTLVDIFLPLRRIRPKDMVRKISYVLDLQDRSPTSAGKAPRYLGFFISRANLAKFSAALGEAVIHSSLSPPVTNSSPLLG